MQPDEPVFLLAHAPNPCPDYVEANPRDTNRVRELVRKTLGPVHAAVYLFMVRTFREEVEGRR